MHVMTYNFLRGLSNLVGVVGVILQLTAYYLLSINRLSSQAFLYSFYNMMGALLILFSLYFQWNMASALVEAVWFLISLKMVLRKLR